VLFCAALLLLTKAVTASQGQWTVYTIKEAVKMPEFYAGGIWDTLWDKPILFPRWTDYVTKAITVPHPLLLIMTTLVFLWRAQKHRIEVILLIFSALATWGVAYMALFYLYEPSRYILYPLMTLWLIILPGAAIEVIRLIEPKLKPTLRRLVPVVSSKKAEFAIAFVVIVTTATTYVTMSRIRHGEGGMIGTAPPEVYRFLQSLPETTKIAAHPIDADDIPMRSRRSVLAFRKAMFPYHREFYEEMKARIAATWTAMYATNYEDILQLKHRYGADILLINDAWYKQDTIKAKPYDAILESCQKKLQGATPLVLHLPREAVVFRRGSFIVIDLAALDRLKSSRINAGL
jgi:hypothetical protein